MCHIAVAMAQKPQQQMAVSHGTHCIVCCTSLCLECKEGYKTYWGHVTAHLYGNCVVVFMWFCVAVVEFVFGVLERRVTESEPTVSGVCYNNIVMWGFVSVC